MGPIWANVFEVAFHEDDVLAALVGRSGFLDACKKTDFIKTESRVARVMGKDLQRDKAVVSGTLQ
jgi:hypothetical protein